MITLSAALAVRNEEKNLARCLSSLKDFADEIVIVDGESDDTTVQIAKKYGAKVLSRPNKSNFHINKQVAIDNCRGKWILQLDADEVVSADLRKEIELIIHDESINPTSVNGYWIPRKNWFLGRFLMKGGQYPDYTLRLYKNGKGKLPQKDVHEQAEVEGEVGHLKKALLHYPYENFLAYLKKWNRYNLFASDLLSSELKHRSVLKKLEAVAMYMVIKPIFWFVWTYGRHKGFYDGWQGFVFSFFSALRFPASYIYYLRSKI